MSARAASISDSLFPGLLLIPESNFPFFAQIPSFGPQIFLDPVIILAFLSVVEVLPFVKPVPGFGLDWIFLPLAGTNEFLMFEISIFLLPLSVADLVLLLDDLFFSPERLSLSGLSDLDDLVDLLDLDLLDLLDLLGLLDFGDLADLAVLADLADLIGFVSLIALADLADLAALATLAVLAVLEILAVLVVGLAGLSALAGSTSLVDSIGLVGLISSPLLIALEDNPPNSLGFLLTCPPKGT
mmetsp:Transcript_17163/g.38663  ORF Transcript_17163/g.38663 Transcript_17163/m.38663 type:complete len:242 (+) Transcript_17163:168-893(+)